MQVSKVSFNQYNQNFSGIHKFLTQDIKRGISQTTFYSMAGEYLGRHIIKANGDVKGERFFSNGARISYNTSHGTLWSKPYVPFEYHFPVGKGREERRFLVFDLEKFKENLKQLTSLKGIKKYLSDIEKAPKKTTYTPCS